MRTEPLLYAIDSWIIAAVMFVLLVAIWEVLFRAAVRARLAAAEPPPDLGSLETAVGGLLALILAFSFTMGTQRFDRRQDVIVQEANAIGTAYLRCAVLEPADKAFCEDRLRRYVDQRIELFEARRDRGRAAAAEQRTDELQRALWDRLVPAVRAADTPSRALLLATLNEMFDLSEFRTASIREIVPAEVTLATLLLCLIWAGFAGFAHGLRSGRRQLAWIACAALLAMVIMVTLDLDRPSRGMIRPYQAERNMLDIHRKLWKDAPK